MNSSTAIRSEGPDACRLTRDFELLRHSPLFTGVHLDVVKLCAYLATRRSFQADDLLLEQGERADRAFIVIQGAVAVTVLHKGRQTLLQRLSDGDVFGELALLAQFDWFYSAKAMSATEVLIISRVAYQKVVEKYPTHKDTLIERIIQLRVGRLIEQTSFILDRLDEAGEPLSAPLI